MESSPTVLLVSTYELGHQPFGIASPAAWLIEAGATVKCIDLSVEKFNEARFVGATLIAFYVPMHTATRIAVALLERVRKCNPNAYLCFYGLYAPPNEEYLRSLGVRSIIGGEFEHELTSLYLRITEGNGTVSHNGESTISTERLAFKVPVRNGLPPLSQYPRLIDINGQRKIVGYTEASRGCKHLCRHCPVVVVYNGTFRIVQRGIVMEDIRQQIHIGAKHITFGDPDFFNGVGHAIPLVQQFHEEFPNISYDVTIKIEHLIKHSEHLKTLKQTGCLYVTSAVESVDNAILSQLLKGHSVEDFIQVVYLCEDVGLVLVPTFVPFTPWTTIQGYAELLETLVRLNLVDHVSPVQLSIRLLIPQGSRLLELPDVVGVISEYDRSTLSYRWWHQDSEVDNLQKDVARCVETGTREHKSRFQQFWDVYNIACEYNSRKPIEVPRTKRTKIPYFSEPWYCCAEPTEKQLEFT